MRGYVPAGRTAFTIPQTMKMNRATTIIPAQDVDGKPFILRDGAELGLHFTAGIVQSLMNFDEPDTLSLGYTRTMMGFLLFASSPKNITMIGLGGGSLPKFCYKYLPGSKICIAEINPDVIALRNEFLIPADDERFQVECEDGADFVRKRSGSEDVIVVDGYDAEGYCQSLCSESFYSDCYQALSDGGVMAVNLFGAKSQRSAIINNIKNIFKDFVVVVVSEDISNRVLFAVKSPAKNFTEKRMLLAAGVLECQINIDFNRIVGGILLNNKNNIYIS